MLSGKAARAKAPARPRRHLVQRRSLDGLIAADDALRAEAPVVAQRVRAPHLGPLRAILMPGARIEIAERLVLHQVHLAEELDSHLVGVAVIDRDVVADDVPAGA